MIFVFFVKYLVTFYFDFDITQVKPGAIFFEKQNKENWSSKLHKKIEKMVPEVRKRTRDKDVSYQWQCLLQRHLQFLFFSKFKESDEEEEFSDDFDDREEETSSIGSTSVSEATSRSETPVGTGSNNTGVVRRGRKGRRKGSHLLGRSPKLSYKYAGFLKEDHGQVYLISLLGILKQV